MSRDKTMFLIRKYFYGSSGDKLQLEKQGRFYGVLSGTMFLTDVQAIYY
jgi:hypothetical protein